MQPIGYSDWKSDVLAMIKKAGFDPKVANAVIKCESGWNPRAIGDNGQSLGLWQLHQPSHNTSFKAFDPYWSTQYAIKLLRTERSWKHWSCFKI